MILIKRVAQIMHKKLITWSVLIVCIGLVSSLYADEQSFSSLCGGILVEEAETLCGDTACQDPAQAIDFLDRVIDLDCKYPHIYFLRGIAYSVLKKYHMAIKDFTTAIELGSFNPRIYHSRGIVYGKLNLYVMAIKDYTMVIDLASKGMALGVYMQRGVVYNELGMIQKACLDFIRYCDSLKIDELSIQFCSMVPKHCSQ